MNKKIIVLMLLLPLLLMISLFTSTKTVAVNVKVAVSKIEISGNDIIYLDLDKNEKYFVNYAIYPVAATNKKIAFVSEMVGTQTFAELEFVDGFIIPKSVGVAKVTLTTVDGGFKDSFVVRVESKSLQSITCSIDKDLLIVGQTTQVQTIFNPDNTPNKALEYETSNSSVATVNAKGEVRGVGKGNAIITVKSEANPQITDTIDIEVVNSDIMDLAQTEVNTSQTSGVINISVDTTEEYEITYKVFNTNNVEISSQVFQTATLTEAEKGLVKFNYNFKEDYIGTIIVKFTITTNNPDRLPIEKSCILNKVEAFAVEFDNKDPLSLEVGAGIPLHNKINLTPEDMDVRYEIQLSNDNLSYLINGNKISLTAIKPGVTTVTLKVISNLPANQEEVISKDVIIWPSSLDINESTKQFGIEEDVWTIAKTEFDGSDNISKLTTSIGKASAGENFDTCFSYVTDNPYVTVNKDGVVKIEKSDINEIVNVYAMFSHEAITPIVSSPIKIRCIGNGVNVRSFNDLYNATNQNKVVVLQSDIIEDFGIDKDGKYVYTEDTVTKIQSTYDTTHYKNMGKLDEAKVKVLIGFKADCYGNGFEINAHNVASGLDATGQPKTDALFKLGPLNFVSMSESAGSLVSVKGQDNISFAVYKDVTLNNVVLKSCNLQPNDEGQYDLGDLTYVGTTVEVLGDNVNIEYCRISNGRTVLRAFGDIEDSNKVIHVNIKNSVLSSSREFIMRIGSNCFVDGNSTNPTPYIEGSENLAIPVQKSYKNMTSNEKLAYENSYIKTFVTLKNSILKDAGLFCIGLDSHFSGSALADGKGLLGGAYEDLLGSWYDLAKTSYGAKLTIEGDVRLYDWKDISGSNDESSVLDSSTLIEVIGNTQFEVLNFDIKELVKKVDEDYDTIIDDRDEVGEYIHGGIAFFGGGKNYGVVDFKNYSFPALFGEYEVKLSDVNKTELQLAAGNESFYFLLYNTNTSFTHSDQERYLNPQDENDLRLAYEPIYKKDELIKN